MPEQTDGTVPDPSGSGDLFRGPALPLGEFSLERLRRIQSTCDASRYEDLGVLGAGGMGVVHEVQDHNLRRRLAMKRLLGQEPLGDLEPDSAPTGDDLRRLARFLEEAQITSQLDHPAIVPVHDLGVDGRGQVFYTMKVVRGRRLSEVFAAHRDGDEEWTLPRCVGLVLKTCEALAYAHDKGILHRDLKPQNVMIGRYGEVYVMDWGLALKTGGPASDTAGSTLGIRTDREEDRRATDSPGKSLEGGAGTPHYMAPEQLSGRVADLTPACDVYAIGATLYQLLTGTVPYADTERNAPLAQWQRLLQGPPRPVSSFDTSAPRELVAICEKAMARDPRERHPSMGALARDLRDFLEGRVVRSFETGAWAELRKWVLRNRGLAAAILVSILTVVTGSVSIAAVQSNARQLVEGKNDLLTTARNELAERNAALTIAKTQADEQASEARRQRDLAQEVVAFVEEIFLLPAPREYRGHDVPIGVILDRGRKVVEDRLGNRPDVLARLRQVLGSVYASLADWPTARGLLEQAHAHFHETRGADDQTTWDAAKDLAEVLVELDEFERAEELIARTLAAQQRVLGPDDIQTLDTLHDETLLIERSERGDARAAYERLIARLDQVLEKNDPDRLAALSNYADFLQEDGDLETAERILTEVLAEEVAHFGHDDLDVVGTKFYLGVLYVEGGQYRKARKLLTEAMAYEEQVLGPDHPDTCLTRFHLAEAYLGLEDYETALVLLEETAEAEARTYGPDHPMTVITRYHVADALYELEEYERALETYEEVDRAEAALYPGDNQETLVTDFDIALTLEMLDRIEEAEARYREVLAAQRELLGRAHEDTLETIECLADMLENEDRDAEAEALYREELADLRADPPGGPDARLLIPLEALADLLHRTGRPAEALPLAEECLELTPAGDEERPARRALLRRIEAALGD